MERIPDYLPGFPPYREWRERVAEPAAGAGEAVLYLREGRSGPATLTPKP